MAKHQGRSENLNKLDPDRSTRLAQIAARIEHLGLTWQPTRRSDGRPRKALFVNGIYYPNATDAALAVGVSEGTIRDVARGDHISPLFTAQWA